MPPHSEIHRLIHLHPVVLLAEDDDALRAQLSTALAHDGNRVISLEDGLELLDYLKLVHAGRLPAPDVIVSEVELTGCGCAEACRHAGLEFSGVPLILLADSGSALAAPLHGEILVKPVDEDELCEVVALHSR